MNRDANVRAPSFPRLLRGKGGKAQTFPNPFEPIRSIVPVNFRLYQPADFERLYAIEEACFEPALRFPRAYLLRIANHPHSATWIAEQNGAMSGFAIVRWSESAAYIETLEVGLDHRRKGIGAELLRRLEDSARVAGAQLIWLHVDAENASAIRLYESHGYEYLDMEKEFYPNGNAALVYRKLLSADV